MHIIFLEKPFELYYYILNSDCKLHKNLKQIDKPQIYNTM